MKRNYVNKDPKIMESRFESVCRCGKPIKKGEKIVYWPNGKKAEHFSCGEKDYLAFLASVEDEKAYNNQYY